MWHGFIPISGFDHIVRAAKNLCNHLELIFQDQEIDAEVRVKNLNVVKMIMYLFSQIMKTKDIKLAADVSYSVIFDLYPGIICSSCMPLLWAAMALPT